jgi:hypothetical protein
METRGNFIQEVIVSYAGFKNIGILGKGDFVRERLVDWKMSQLLPPNK